MADLIPSLKQHVYWPHVKESCGKATAKEPNKFQNKKTGYETVPPIKGEGGTSRQQQAFYLLDSNTVIKAALLYKNYLGEQSQMVYWLTDTKRRQTGPTRMPDQRQERKDVQEKTALNRFLGIVNTVHVLGQTLSMVHHNT